MKATAQSNVRVFLLVIVALVCFACGPKQDYSGNNELAKTQSSGAQAPAAAESGKGATAHAGLMVPTQRHP